jgi:hypothetical protein
MAKKSKGSKDKGYIIPTIPLGEVEQSMLNEVMAEYGYTKISDTIRSLIREKHEKIKKK